MVVQAFRALLNEGDIEAARVGLEPTTSRLTAERSTIELSGRIFSHFL